MSEPTPEERAQEIVDFWDSMNVDDETLLSQITAGIRKSVAQEGEECTKAICVGCREHEVLYQNEYGGFAHKHSFAGAFYGCAASSIRARATHQAEMPNTEQDVNDKSNRKTATREHTTLKGEIVLSIAVGSFEWAMIQLKGGCRVRRPCWPKHWFADGTQMVMGLMMEDVKATDWTASFGPTGLQSASTSNIPVPHPREAGTTPCEIILKPTESEEK